MLAVGVLVKMTIATMGEVVLVIGEGSKAGAGEPVLQCYLGAWREEREPFCQGLLEDFVVCF